MNPIYPVEPQGVPQGPQEPEKNQGYGFDFSAVSSWVGSGVRALAGFVTSMVPVDIADTVLDSERSKLFALTKSTVAEETAKVIAKRQVHKFAYFLGNPDKLKPEDIHGGLKKFLQVKDGAICRTYKGELFFHGLSFHKETLERLFECNILRALYNGISYVQALPKNDPLFLVKLMQDTLQEVAEELQNPHKAAELTQKEHEEFMRKLNKALVKALFPHGEEDMYLPLPMEKMFGINKQLFFEVQESLLPRKIGVIYDKATSEVNKYRLLRKVANTIKEFVAAEPKKSEKEKKELLFTIAPEAQEAFNEQLKNAVNAFLGYVDSSLIRLLRPIIAKKAASYGPVLVDKILQVDFSSQLEEGMKNLCLKYSPQGAWKTVDGRQCFEFVAKDPLPLSRQLEEENRELARNKAEVAEVLNSVADDLNGLVLRVAKVKNPKESDHLLGRIKRQLKIVFSKLRKTVVALFFKIFGVEKRIKKLAKKVLDHAEQFDLKNAAKPVKRVIIQPSVLQ